MAYFRLEEPAAAKPAVLEPVAAAVAAAAEKPLPRVEIQMVHPEWLIVMIVGENGIEDVKRADSVREAVELAQNLALLGFAQPFGGKIQEVRALV